MTPADLKDWLGVAAFFISLAGTVYVWLTRPGEEAMALVRETETRMDGKMAKIEERISHFEGDLKGVATRNSVHQVELEMGRLRASIDVLTERMVGVSASTLRVQEFFLERTKGSHS